MWLPLARPLLGTWPTTQARALTGNWTGDPLVHRLALNPLSHTSQGKMVTFEWSYVMGWAGPHVRYDVHQIQSKSIRCCTPFLFAGFFKVIGCSLSGSGIVFWASAHMVTKNSTWVSGHWFLLGLILQLWLLTYGIIYLRQSRSPRGSTLHTYFNRTHTWRQTSFHHIGPAECVSNVQHCTSEPFSLAWLGVVNTKYNIQVMHYRIVHLKLI